MRLCPRPTSMIQVTQCGAALPGTSASHRPLLRAGENGPRRAGKETLKSVFLVSRIIPNTIISRAIRDYAAEHEIPRLIGTIDRPYWL